VLHPAGSRHARRNLPRLRPKPRRQHATRVALRDIKGGAHAPPFAIPCSSDQTPTVTRIKFAGIYVRKGSPLAFCALNSASNLRRNSVSRPFFSAASNAFIVGP